MGTVWVSALAGRALEPVADEALWHPASIEVLQGTQLELSLQSSCPFLLKPVSELASSQ